MSFLRHAAIVAWKDLRVELRTREILYTMAFLATIVVLIFSFAFLDEEGKPVADVTAGMLWVAVAFAGMLGLGRAFEREREGDTMRGLLLSPASRGSLFVGKAAGIALFMVIVEAAVVPLIGVLFNAPVLDHWPELAALLALATVGFAVVGSVFAAMLLRSRMRGVLLPVILYPIIVPALIAGAKGTAALFADPARLGMAAFWIKFLVVYDALFVTVALWAFESLVIE